MSKYDNFKFPEGISKSNQTSFNRLPDFVKDLVVAGNNYNYAGMSRRAMLITTEEELEAMANLCRGKDKPGNYWASLISKANFEKTLVYVRRILARSVEAIAYVARKINNRTKSYLNYVADKIAEGKYSMANVVNMVEIAEKKSAPDRYLIGILKKGYVHFKPKTT